MTLLVFIIAITNLCLGYICGVLALRLNASPRLAEAEQQGLPRTHGTVAAPSPSMHETHHVPAFIEDEVPEPSIPVEPTAKPEPAAPTPAPSPEAPPKSWEDFCDQLTLVRERLGYARSIEDRQLASDVGGQLEACAQSWFGHLQETLETALTGDAEAPADEAADTMQLEMCLAQFETTLANLQSFDWKAEAGTVFTKLQKEVEALEACQKVAGLATAS